MRDEADLKKVRDKLREGQYHPAAIDDGLPLTAVEIDAVTGKVRRGS